MAFDREDTLRCPCDLAILRNLKRISLSMNAVVHNDLLILDKATTCIPAATFTPGDLADDVFGKLLFFVAGDSGSEVDRGFGWRIHKDSDRPQKAPFRSGGWRRKTGSASGAIAAARWCSPEFAGTRTQIEEHDCR